MQVLTLIRIPRVESRRVAFFQHGLLDSASAWVSTGNVFSLAARAYQSGYDVFLGNFRGSNDALGVSGRPRGWEWLPRHTRVLSVPQRFLVVIGACRSTVSGPILSTTARSWRRSRRQRTTAWWALRSICARASASACLRRLHPLSSLRSVRPSCSPTACVARRRRPAWLQPPQQSGRQQPSAAARQQQHQRLTRWQLQQPMVTRVAAHPSPVVQTRQWWSARGRTVVGRCLQPRPPQRHRHPQGRRPRARHGPQLRLRRSRLWGPAPAPRAGCSVPVCTGLHPRARRR